MTSCNLRNLSSQNFAESFDKQRFHKTYIFDEKKTHLETQQYYLKSTRYSKEAKKFINEVNVSVTQSVLSTTNTISGHTS